MFKKIKEFRNSINRVPLERGRTPYKCQRGTTSRYYPPPTGIGRLRKGESLPLLARLLPNFPFKTNRSTFLSYLQAKQLSSSVSACLALTTPKPRLPGGRDRAALAPPCSPSSARRDMSFQRTHADVASAPNSREHKRNSQLVRRDSYLKSLKNNVRVTLERQMDKIREMENKRVKKDIISAGSLQKMVVDKIREGNRLEMPTRLPENTRKTDLLENHTFEKNKLSQARIIEKKQPGSLKTSSVNNSSVVSHSEMPRILDHFKNKYQTELTLQEKISADNYKSEETVKAITNKATNTDKTTAFLPVGNIKKTLIKAKRFDQLLREEKKEAKELKTLEELGLSRSPTSVAMSVKGKSREHKQEGKRSILQQLQFSQVSSSSPYQLKPNHTASGKFNANVIQSNVFNKGKNASLSTPKRKINFPSKVDQNESKNDAVAKALEELGGTKGNHLHITFGKGSDETPRDRNPRQLPNFVRDGDKVAFSHKSLILRDSELYRKFRVLERERRLRTIYNSHWSYKMPRDPAQTGTGFVSPANVRQPLFKPPRPVVVHKLNASSIAENIKQRAKIINKNKIKDEFLQPQVYCKQSLSYGLAQMPIVPCKNIIARDTSVDMMKKRRPIYLGTGTPKASRGNKLYAQAMKMSRPLWDNQEMLTTNQSHPHSRRKAPPPSKKMKIDFKGTLKYIMNLKSRLQRQ